MKKHGAGILILVLIVIAVWGIILPVYGQEKAKPEGATKETAPFTIKRLVVGVGVEGGEPVGVAETFPASTEKVYCFLEATDISKDMEVSFVWSRSAPPPRDARENRSTSASQRRRTRSGGPQWRPADRR